MNIIRHYEYQIVITKQQLLRAHSKLKDNVITKFIIFYSPIPIVKVPKLIMV